MFQFIVIFSINIWKIQTSISDECVNLHPAKRKGKWVLSKKLKDDGHLPS